MANANMVIKYSAFTKDLTKVLKKSERIHCTVDTEGMIYVCNGFIAVRLSSDEYDALVRPATQRDAGEWVLHEGVLSDVDEKPMDIAKCISDAANNAAHDIIQAPLFFEEKSGKTTYHYNGYYSESGDFVQLINSKYSAIVNSGVITFKSQNPISPAVAFWGGDAVAIIMPVRLKGHENQENAIRAWFGAYHGTDNGESAKKLNDLRKDLNDSINSANAIEAENVELRRQLEELRQQYAQAAIERKASQDHADELESIIASKNEQIDGLVYRLNNELSASIESVADESESDTMDTVDMPIASHSAPENSTSVFMAQAFTTSARKAPVRIFESLADFAKRNDAPEHSIKWCMPCKIPVALASVL